MAKNKEQTSRMDAHQIQKRMFSQEHDAMRVILAENVETSFSLNHKDGDSIASHCAAKVMAPGNHDCSDIQKFQAYGSGTVTVYADAHNSCEYQVSPGTVVEICAMSLKTDVTLVGR